MEAPDSEENAAYFGYAGKKGRSAFPFVRMAALAECSTHAIVAADIAKDGEGEETLARRILSAGAARAGMIVMADRGSTATRTSGWSWTPEPTPHSG